MTLSSERSSVTMPYSIGVRCTKGSQEGSLVLFRGGWADLEYWAGGDADVVVEAPGWENWLSIASFAALLDRFFNMFG